MHNNHIYNLFSMLTQEHRGIWRIKKYFLKDSGNCKKCRELWKKIEKDKQEHIKMILDVLKDHKL